MPEDAQLCCGWQPLRSSPSVLQSPHLCLSSLTVLLQAAPLLQIVICASESIDIAGRDCAQNEVTGLPDEALADLLLQLAPQVKCHHVVKAPWVTSAQ